MDKVLCVVEEIIKEDIDWDEQALWMDLEWPKKNYTIIKRIIPVYNHPHSDKENGQKEVHYHVDSRYLDPINSNIYGWPIRVSLPLNENQKLEYQYLTRTGDHEKIITPVSLIKNSKLKHKCIHKGKCPHRGYDLSNEIPDQEGNITCPLHGLRFNKKKEIINLV